MGKALGEVELERLIVAGQDLVSDLDLETVLQRVLETAVAVTGARYAALGVLDEDRHELERFLHHGIDEQTRRKIGELPRGRGVLGALIREPKPLRIRDVSAHPASYGFPEHHPPMGSFLGVPIVIRGEEWGNLYLTEKQGDDEFDAADEEAAVVLAGWAAIAIDNARSVAADRLRHAIDAAEQERKAWARELHDETLQGLGALKVLLGAGLKGDRKNLETVAERALAQIDSEITSLRALIGDLRPGSLDELGLPAALESLCHRLAERSPKAQISLSVGAAVAERGIPGPIETTIYRIVQEALTNALRHSGAARLRVRLDEKGGWISASVADDGRGFDTAGGRDGFGLRGVRERVRLARGRLTIDSVPGEGTVLGVELPLRRVVPGDDRGAFAVAAGAELRG
jgi:signal transduction histidine kinase